MASIRSLLAAFVVAFFAFAADAVAQQQPEATGRVRIDVTEGHLNPMPIAVVDFLGQSGPAQQVGRDVAQVIRANLDRSGLFRPIEPGAFIERIGAMEVPPRFADWRIIDAQALVVGQVTPLPDGRIRIEFRLWDTFGEQSLTGFQ